MLVPHLYSGSFSPMIFIFFILSYFILSSTSHCPPLLLLSYFILFYFTLSATCTSLPTHQIATSSSTQKQITVTSHDPDGTMNAVVTFICLSCFGFSIYRRFTSSLFSFSTVFHYFTAFQKHLREAPHEPRHNLLP